MKIRGNDKIPDYLQIRDDNYTLIAYFKLSKIENGLKKFKLLDYLDKINEVVENIEYGKIIKIN